MDHLVLISINSICIKSSLGNKHKKGAKNKGRGGGRTEKKGQTELFRREGQGTSSGCNAEQGKIENTLFAVAKNLLRILLSPASYYRQSLYLLHRQKKDLEREDIGW